ncbi:MAG: cytochrome c oxidase subunit 3 [Candidatus Acidiferrum sp.]
MAAGSVLDEVEIVIDDIGRGGGNKPPSHDDHRGGGGDDGSHRPRRPNAAQSGQKKYQTAILLGMVSIFMFFMALSAAFLVRKTGKDWIQFRLPGILWLNTVVLLTSSLTMDLSRRRLALGDMAGFKSMWRATTALGLAFLAGQFVAWRELVARGYYVGSNPSSSFFYVFTVAHAVHLVGGIGALLYVLFRNFNKTRVSLSVASEITSYFWHFMDGLWLFLLALLYFGA